MTTQPSTPLTPPASPPPASPPPAALTASQRARILEAMRRAVGETDPCLARPRESGRPGGLDELDRHLEPLVEVVRRTTADRVEPYLGQIVDDVCRHCPHRLPSAACPLRQGHHCVLFEHARPIVLAVGECLREMGDPAYLAAHATENPPTPQEQPGCANAAAPAAAPAPAGFRHVLIAIDGSEPARRALEAGAGLARLYGATVTLLHVVHPPVPVTPPAPGRAALSEVPVVMPAYEQVVAGLLSRGREIVDAAEAALPEDLRGRAAGRLVVDGRPADAIVEEARRCGADLVVVGNHNRHAWSRFLLGSTSDALVRHAPCPVLVVRPPDEANEASETKREPA